MSINNYVKTVARRPSIMSDLFDCGRGHNQDEPTAGYWYHVEYWFFDDTDIAATAAVFDKVQAFKSRQPIGTRFATSIYRAISLKKVDVVGETPKALQRAA